MRNKSRKIDIDTLFDNDALIEAALKRGVRKALRQHKVAGLPIVGWRNGRIVYIRPEDIDLNESPPRRKSPIGRRRS